MVPWRPFSTIFISLFSGPATHAEPSSGGASPLIQGPSFKWHPAQWVSNLALPGSGDDRGARTLLCAQPASSEASQRMAKARTGVVSLLPTQKRQCGVVLDHDSFGQH